MKTTQVWLVAVGVGIAGGALGSAGTAFVERRSHAAQAKLPPPTQSQVSQAEAVGHTFAQVASQVGPSVVRITVTTKAEKPEASGRPDSFGNPFKGTPFERFFDEFGDEKPDRPRRQVGMGSGVVLDKRGYILTNNHVVSIAETVKVTFVDGKEVPAKIVGKDPKSDLAVVKVDGVDVKPAHFANSDDLHVGDWVMAIGNPFGLDHTVTVGVLSAKNRSGFQSGHYEDFLQTDASINPGNSGGPLVDLNGNVVGINTMIAGVGTGIGFAVPTSMAKPIADQLIETGKVRRPWIGIAMQDMTPELDKALGNKAPDKGALVAEIQADSPAKKAGLRPGDIITSVDGKPVKGSRDVQADVLARRIGDKVDLAIWRDGKSEHVEMKTGELPAQEEEKSAPGEGSTHEKLGLGLENLTPEIRQQLNLPSDTKGAVVAQVASGSASELAGVKQGDVIVEVDRKPVASAEEAVSLLRARRAGAHLLRVRRGQSALFIVLSSE
jgi:serine protease Do